MISYEIDYETQEKLEFIANRLGFYWVDLSRIVCVKSRGSKSKRIVARCHALSKIMQLALGTKAHYVIEMVSKNFDKLNEEDKIKTLIHELMHIPRGMGGGFRHHRPHVNRKTVDRMYKRLLG